MSPTANLSYHGNQASPTFQPRSSPSATINHYGTTAAPVHGSSGSSKTTAAAYPGRNTPPLLVRAGEAGSGTSSHQQPIKKRHRFHSVEEERLRGGK